MPLSQITENIVYLTDITYFSVVSNAEIIAGIFNVALTQLEFRASEDPAGVQYFVIYELLSAAAFFILFPTSARTRIISADFSTRNRH